MREKNLKEGITGRGTLKEGMEITDTIEEMTHPVMGKRTMKEEKAVPATAIERASRVTRKRTTREETTVIGMTRGIIVRHHATLIESEHTQRGANTLLLIGVIAVEEERAISVRLSTLMREEILIEEGTERRKHLLNPSDMIHSWKIRAVEVQQQAGLKSRNI